MITGSDLDSTILKYHPLGQPLLLETSITIKSYQRGHTIVFQDIWRYEDGQSADTERQCV